MSKKSKRFKQAASVIEVGKHYGVKEAVELIKTMPPTKFDQSVELHLKLGVDTKQANQQVRGSVVLPSGLGKTKRIAVFCGDDKAKEAKDAGATLVGGEDLIKTIAQTGQCDFDVAVATPDMMKKMAPIAKILGQKGLMPNPKTETISNDVGKVVKVSLAPDKLQANIEALLQAVKKAKPAGAKGTYMQNAVLTSTMGQAVHV